MDKLRCVRALTLTLACCITHCAAKDRQELMKRDAPQDAPGPLVSRIVIPVDTRPPISPAAIPPPISGGTLLATRDGAVIVADPDRDRISIVDPDEHTVRHIELDPGDEPGRIVEDWQGLVHVVLRRGGAVLSIDPAEARIGQRRSVCGAPRGLASDDDAEVLYVACAGGAVMHLDGEEGEAELLMRLAPGLRDVVVHDGALFVTNFKRAEMVAIKPDATTGDARTPDVTTRAAVGGGGLVDMLPNLAWKTMSGPGGIYMLHQRASTATIELEQGAGPTLGPPPYYGDTGVPCSGIVHSAVSRFGDDPTDGRIAAITGGVLAVDMAVDAHGLVALALAGAQDRDAPQRFIEVSDPDDPSMVVDAVSAVASTPASTSSGLVVMKPPAVHPDSPFGACITPTTLDVDGQITAVAFLEDGRLIAQSRQPARLFVGDPTDAMVTIELGGAGVEDTGHELFHRDAGAGIACASCHAEGGDDGHTWSFSSIGLRRTQALHIGLADTAPFHWDGDMPDVSDLMEEVRVTRMGGVHQSAERMRAFESWMFALQPPAPVRSFDAEDLTLSLGRSLFTSAEVGCADCHNGSKLTNNLAADVGTDAAGPLQVPSLVGIAYRAPFLHDGCADTMRERFDPTCGGHEHGNTEWLDDGQIDALIAYMETL